MPIDPPRFLGSPAIQSLHASERVRQKFIRNARFALADLSDEDFEKVIEEARRHRNHNPQNGAYQ